MKKSFLKAVAAVLLFSAFVFGQVACDNNGDGTGDDNDTLRTEDTTTVY